MLDLNNIALSSLFMLNSQENIEPEQITAVQEESQDDDNSIDPNTFLFLLAQISPEFAEETPKESTKSDSINFIKSETATSTAATNSDKGLNPEALNRTNLEENVAITWINSEYYQSERNSSTITAEAQPIPATEFSETLSVGTQAFIDEQPSIETSPTLFALDLPDNSQIETETKTHLQLSQLNSESRLTQVESDDISLQNFEINEQDEIGGVLVVDSQLSGDRGMLSNKNTSLVTLANSKSQHDLSSKDEDIEYFHSSDLEAENIPRAKVEQISEFTVSQPEANSLEHPGIVERPLANHVVNSWGDNSVLSAKQAERSSMQNTLSIPMDIDDPQWSKQFSEQVMWLGQQGIKNATIKIHPEELGPIEISIKMINDSASVSIISHSQQVREMIDQSVSRLHTMMAEQGLNLSEFNVNSDEGTRQFAKQHEGSSQEEVVYLDETEEEALLTPVKNKTKPQGVIDYFA